MAAAVPVKISQGSPCVDMCDPRAAIQPGRYAVQNIEQMEMLTQPLYSYQSYPAAGAQTLSFFTFAATGAVTAEDTNMLIPSQMPSPQAFLVQSLGVDYLPGLTAAAPVTFGAQAATGQANDVMAIFRRGILNFTVGAKSYLQMAPLMSMPCRSYISGDFGASDQTTPGATMQLRMNLARPTGPVMKINPILLETGQNFNITINFPGGAVPTPSTDALARIGVILYGTLYRPPQ